MTNLSRPTLLTDSTPEDPHPTYLEAWHQSLKSWNLACANEGETSRNALRSQGTCEQLEALIYETEAHTSDGLMAQLQWLMEDSEKEEVRAGHKAVVQNCLQYLKKQKLACDIQE